MRWNVMIEMETLLMVFGDLDIFTRPLLEILGFRGAWSGYYRIAEVFSCFSYCRGLQL